MPRHIPMSKALADAKHVIGVIYLADRTAVKHGELYQWTGRQYNKVIEILQHQEIIGPRETVTDRIKTHFDRDFPFGIA